MTTRLWGHDAIRIEMPFAVAKLISEPHHPARQEVLDAISSHVAEILKWAHPLDPGPMAMIIDGVLVDGNDMSMGPVAYVRKVFLTDVERDFEELRRKIENGER